MLIDCNFKRIIHFLEPQQSKVKIAPDTLYRFCLQTWWLLNIYLVPFKFLYVCTSLCESFLSKSLSPRMMYCPYKTENWVWRIEKIPCDHFLSMLRLQYRLWFTGSWTEEKIQQCAVSWCQLRNVRAAVRSMRPQMEIWQANGPWPLRQTEISHSKNVVRCRDSVYQTKRHDKTSAEDLETFMHS